MPTLGFGVGIGIAIGSSNHEPDCNPDPDPDPNHYRTTDSPGRRSMHVGDFLVELLEIKRLTVHERVRGFGHVTV